VVETAAACPDSIGRDRILRASPKTSMRENRPTRPWYTAPTGRSPRYRSRHRFSPVKRTTSKTSPFECSTRRSSTAASSSLVTFSQVAVWLTSYTSNLQLSTTSGPGHVYRRGTLVVYSEWDVYPGIRCRLSFEFNIRKPLWVTVTLFKPLMWPGMCWRAVEHRPNNHSWDRLRV